jgi:ABC-type tungstate transport system permease subunit
MDLWHFMVYFYKENVCLREALMKRVLSMAIALLACLLLTACGGKTAKLLVSTDFSNSALLKQLVDAFTKETGITLTLDAKSNADVEGAVKNGAFDAALVITQSATAKLTSGEWIGGAVFYNTLDLIGPKNDPASVHSLTHFAAKDVLKHLSMTSATSTTIKFVHPNLVTVLGMKDAELWLSVNAAATPSQFFSGDDDGQQMVQLANQQGAYAFITRQNWALYKSAGPNLTVLLSGIPGMMDQYTVLAKKISGNPNAAQSFCQWMMGQSARSIVLAYSEQGATVPAFESNIPAK